MHGPKELYRGGVAKRAYAGLWPLAATMAAVASFIADSAGPAGLVLLAAAASIGAVPHVMAVTSEYVVTETGARHRIGRPISRRASRVDLRDIDDVLVRQGFRERFLGYGDVLLSSAVCSDFCFAKVAKPHALAELIREAQHRVR